MFKTKTISMAALIAASLSFASTAQAGSEEYLGEIMLVGYNFCPRGTTEANGQLLPISQNTALFSLYGTTYGGDGRTTFALPDLRGRTVVHSGRGAGLTDRRMGSRGGAESVATSKIEVSNGDTQAVSGKRPASNMQPFLTLKYCVVMQGTYPSRS